MIEQEYINAFDDILDEIKSEKSWYFTANKRQYIWNGKKLLRSVQQNLSRLLTFDELIDQYDSFKKKTKRQINGVGYWTNRESKYAIVDLDVKDGIQDDELDAIEQLVKDYSNETLILQSSGGKGYHIFLPKGTQKRNRTQRGCVEVFVANKPVAINPEIVGGTFDISDDKNLIKRCVALADVVVDRRRQKEQAKAKEELFNRTKNDLKDDDYQGQFIYSLPIVVDNNFLPDLVLTDSGAPLLRQKTTFENVQAILHVAGLVPRYNIMTKNIDFHTEDKFQKEMIEQVDLQGQEIMMRLVHNHAAKYGLCEKGPGFRDFTRHVDTLATKNKYHPFGDFLKSNKWDGVERLSNLIDTVTVREDYKDAWKLCFPLWLLQVVDACVSFRKPKQKRHVLTFQGRQKIGKSTFIKLLFNIGDGRKYAGEVNDVEDMDGQESIRQWTKLLVAEIAEMDMLAKKEQAKVKKVLSLEYDNLRPLYQNHREIPRCTVFYASSNETNLLSDPTGNTRWWPIVVDSFNLDAVRDIDVQQLWLEIYDIYQKVMADHTDGTLPWDLSMNEQKVLDKLSEEFQDNNPVVEQWFQYVQDTGLSAQKIENLPDDEKRFVSASTVSMELGTGKLFGKQSTPLVKAIESLLGPASRRGNIKQGWWMPKHFYPKFEEELHDSGIEMIKNFNFRDRSRNRIF